MDRDADTLRGVRLPGSRRYRRRKKESAEAGVLRLKRHVAIYSEGSAAQGVWQIVEGTVIVYKMLSDGRRQITDVARDGGWIGTPYTGRYSSSAETLSDSKLRFYSHEELAAVPAVRRTFTNYLETRIEALEDHALLLGRKSAMERIASFLLSLPALGVPARSLAASGPDESTFTIPLRQRDIGDYLGLKVETVSRNLAKLRRQMIIATGKRGQFLLLDRDALRSIAISG